MLLIQLKQHLQTHRLVSLADMVRDFNADPSVLRDMLQHWINKGRVRQLNKTMLCRTKCLKCDPLTIELYEWIE